MSVDMQTALGEVARNVDSYLAESRDRAGLRPAHLASTAYAYLERSGKRLRPAVLLWSCGAVGGNPESALPAAAGVELFHTWTLVHDDLIDNDDSRRGGPSVHALGRRLAKDELGYKGQAAVDYGRDIAVLTGDCQHGWTVSLFCELAERGVDCSVVLRVIRMLESETVNTLLEGELLDVQYAGMSIDKVSGDDIVRMLWMKTGALYRFAAAAGAMIGLGTSDASHPLVDALARFASECGTAFQLQDDILGLMGDQRKLGKPVGADIKEGKKTLLVFYALENCSSADRHLLLGTLGDKSASESDITRAKDIIVSTGAVDHVRSRSHHHLSRAMESLDTVPHSKYRDLLAAWAAYMIERTF